MNRNSRASAGSTLIEILVYIALFALVLVVIYTILTTEVRLFRLFNEQVTVRQSALKSTIRLTSELTEASLQSIALYSPGSSVPGIVFMSPRVVTSNSTGGVQYSTMPGFEGTLAWSSFICYYRDIDSTDTTKYVLRRKVVPNLGSTTASSVVDLYSPQWFSSNQAIGGGQVVARDLLALDIYWWNPATGQQYYGAYQASYDPLVYIAATCKRQNVTTLRKQGASYFNEVIYGIDRACPQNRN